MPVVNFRVVAPNMDDRSSTVSLGKQYVRCRVRCHTRISTLDRSGVMYYTDLRHSSHISVQSVTLAGLFRSPTVGVPLSCAASCLLQRGSPEK